MPAAKRDQIIVNGRQLVVSNLEKVLFPGYKFTKADVIEYYIRASKHLLPHLKNRPLTLKRFPDGVFGQFFYEKDAPAFTPKWVKTVPVPRRDASGPDIRYIIVDDLPTLVWLANLANIELHPFLHRVPKLHQPTSIVFDCDPGEGTTLLDCARVAFLLRSKFEQLGLVSLAKVSGSKGLQVYVPMNTRVTYEITQAFARRIAEIMTSENPSLVVADMSKALRKKKVFIDWSQNSDYKTTVGVYSLRAKSYKPLVSMPVSWNELQTALDTKDAEALQFNPQQALTRLEQLGDLFAPVRSLKQNLPEELQSHVKPKTGSRLYTRARGSSVLSNPQGSRQGSRRRFLIQEKQDRSYNLRLEAGTGLRSWVLQKLPRKARAQTAKQVTDAPLKMLKSPARRQTWDTGTYQLIEGDMNRDTFRIYVKGEKLKAELSFTRAPGNPRQWRIANHTNLRNG